MEENGAEYMEAEPETEETTFDGNSEETTETEESGGNVDGISDSTDGNTNVENTADTGTDTAASAGTPLNDAGNAPETSDGDLLESLNALIEVLSPEEETEDGETDGAETDESTSEPEVSEYDIQTLETLQGIQSTLSAIQSENELWHTETLKYREETKEMQKDITAHLEYISLLLIAVGFFVAFLCGGKFADIFFKRMKGDGRNE